jgi:acyl carrier protein
MQTVAQEFRRFINENFMFGQMNGDFSDEDSFLERGIIDSTGVLELIGFIEDTYHITFDDVDLVPENLDSIGGLAKFVEKKRNGSPAQGGPLASSIVS